MRVSKPIVVAATALIILPSRMSVIEYNCQMPIRVAPAQGAVKIELGNKGRWTARSPLIKAVGSIKTNNVIVCVNERKLVFVFTIV